MSEWKKVKLQDVCSSITDGDHLAPPKSDLGVPFITISNIDSYNHIDFSNCMYVPQEYYNKLDIKRKAQKGDILYSVVGSFGKPVLINDNMPFAFQRHIAILRPNNKIILPEYMYYVMLTYDFFMQADSVALGAAQRTISLTSLRNMTIKLAPLDEQRKIAYILSRYDSLIDNYQRQIKLLEEAAQRLYKEWFVDLHFPGYENTKIVDGVPEGWGRKKLHDVLSYVRGRSYSTKEISDKGIPMVNLKNLKPFGGYNYGNEKYYLGTYKKEQTLCKGDLIMGVTDMTKERRLVGSVAVVPYLGETVTFSMDLIKLIPLKLPKAFLYCMLRYGGLSREISILANGVNVLHLKPQSFEDKEILIPKTKLVEEFTHLVSLILERNWSINSQLRLLTEARDRLLPKLMSGEIDVGSSIK